MMASPSGAGAGPSQRAVITPKPLSSYSGFMTPATRVGADTAGNQEHINAMEHIRNILESTGSRVIQEYTSAERFGQRLAPEVKEILDDVLKDESSGITLADQSGYGAGDMDRFIKDLSADLVKAAVAHHKAELKDSLIMQGVKFRWISNGVRS